MITLERANRLIFWSFNCQMIIVTLLAFVLGWFLGWPGVFIAVGTSLILNEVRKGVDRRIKERVDWYAERYGQR